MFLIVLATESFKKDEDPPIMHMQLLIWLCFEGHALDQEGLDGYFTLSDVWMSLVVGSYGDK